MWECVKIEKYHGQEYRIYRRRSADGKRWEYGLGSQGPAGWYDPTRECTTTIKVAREIARENIDANH